MEPILGESLGEAFGGDFGADLGDLGEFDLGELGRLGEYFTESLEEALGADLARLSCSFLRRVMLVSVFEGGVPENFGILTVKGRRRKSGD